MLTSTGAVNDTTSRINAPTAWVTRRRWSISATVCSTALPGLLVFATRQR